MRSVDVPTGASSRHGAGTPALRVFIYTAWKLRIPTVRLETYCRDFFISLVQIVYQAAINNVEKRIMLQISRKQLTCRKKYDNILKLSKNRERERKEKEKIFQKPLDKRNKVWYTLKVAWNGSEKKSSSKERKASKLFTNSSQTIKKNLIDKTNWKWYTK